MFGGSSNRSDMSGAGGYGYMPDPNKVPTAHYNALKEKDDDTKETDRITKVVGELSDKLGIKKDDKGKKDDKKKDDKKVTGAKDAKAKVLTGAVEP